MGRTKNVGTSRNDTQSGLQVADSIAWSGRSKNMVGEISPREKFHAVSPANKSKFYNSKNEERPSIRSGISQYSFMANPC